MKGLVVLISNLNLKYLGLQIFNCEGSLEFPVEKLELGLTQHIGLCGNNFIGVKSG